MYTTNNESLLNNDAVELAIYDAELPSEWQQQRYAFQGELCYDSSKQLTWSIGD